MHTQTRAPVISQWPMWHQLINQSTYSQSQTCSSQSAINRVSFWSSEDQSNWVIVSCLIILIVDKLSIDSSCVKYWSLINIQSIGYYLLIIDSLTDWQLITGWPVCYLSPIKWLIGSWTFDWPLTEYWSMDDRLLIDLCSFPITDLLWMTNWPPG